MCRFAFYKGPSIPLSSLLTDPKHSLIKQSFESKEREEPLNGDGFGLAWYVDDMEEPALFRSITPAWNNENLIDLARVTKSQCVMAHVRAATQGVSVIQSNCHPFRRGPLAFMHNGDIGGFQNFRRHFLGELSDESFKAIQGNTDSEHFFALLVDELRFAKHESRPKRMGLALKAALRRVQAMVEMHTPGEEIYLNAVLTDGKESVACRYSTDHEQYAETLYTHRGQRYVCKDGVCRMLNPGLEKNALIISSEPLSDDAGWDPVPINSIVIVHADLSMEVEQLTV